MKQSDIIHTEFPWTGYNIEDCHGPSGLAKTTIPLIFGVNLCSSAVNSKLKKQSQFVRSEFSVLCATKTNLKKQSQLPDFQE